MSCDISTQIANLCTRRTAITVELAAMGPTKAGGLPNRASEGINVDHVGYRKSLLDELKMLNDLIEQLESENDGSVWSVSVGTG